MFYYFNKVLKISIITAYTSGIALEIENVKQI